MIIKKITLENFKIHLNREFSFEPGINVIVGKNGAGKTSIVEAIGVALLWKTEKSLSSLVSRVGGNNKKTFTVSLEFVGNDGVEYVLIRKFNPSQHILKTKDGIILATDEVNVTEKVSKLIGLEGANLVELYSNIVCAYQNKLTDIFQRKRENAELLNRILETEVYDKISEQFRSVEREYENKYKNLDDLEQIFEVEIKKFEGVEEKLQKAKEFYNSLTEQIQLAEEEVSKLKKEREEVLAKTEELDKLEGELRNIKTELKTRTEQLRTLKNDLVQSQQAKERLKLLESDYKKFREIEANLRQLRDELNKAYQMSQKKAELENKVVELKKEQEYILNRLEEKESQIRETNEMIFVKTGELQSLRGQLEEKVVQLKETTKLRIELQSRLKEFEVKYEEYSRILDKTKTLKKELEQVGDVEKDIAALTKEIEELERQRRLLNDVIKVESEIVTEKSRLESEISRIKETMEKLSSGLCPILKDQCQNLRLLGGLEKFVESNTAQLKEYNEKLTKLREQLDEIAVAKNKIESVDLGIRKSLEERAKLLQLKEQLNAKKLELEHLEVQIREFEKDGSLLENKEKMQRELEYIVSQEARLDSEIKHLNLQISNLEGDIKNFNDRAAEISKEISNLEARKRNVEDELLELEKKLREFGEIERKIKELEDQVRIFEEDLLQLRPKYEEYISTEPLASRTEDLEKRKSELLKSVQELSERLNELENTLRNFESREALENKRKSVEKRLEELSNELAGLKEKMGSCKKELENLEKQLEEKEEKMLKLNELKVQKERCLRKLELTKEFREKLKRMGAEITSTLVDTISKIATQTYRVISGKNEEIRIDTAEKNFVFLLRDEQDNEREFSLLSGGEQVSVAIALRIALAKTLTKSDLYILDEPTINLDVERRKAFAENLKNFFGQFGQVLIITHDEEFKDMGYHVLEV
ncbi:AAA family ATPase [Fervidobacterium thailandense]|uniref:Uncharacterized protein n=1 Tax=Fervidobacterium thailandense TaxID=1008305 RepID=A0A1E3G2U8_9BACT|nr:AAA family ATPase [Fervidobacterium thailandense]ODN30492.1 hypothetical protein A4H02_05550 [Fervidobacterium thailandense]